MPARKLTLALFTIGLLQLVGAASSPGRVPPLRSLGQTVELLTIDKRYVAYGPRVNAVRIYDQRTQRSRDFAVPANCTLVDVASARALLSCVEGQEYGTSGLEDIQIPYLLNVTNGAFRRVVARGPAAPGGRVPNIEWYSMGRYWLGGYANCYHCTGAFINWHTGEVYRPSNEEEEILLSFDLDLPGLTRPANRTPGLVATDGKYQLIQPGVSHRFLVLRTRGRRDIRLSTCSAKPCLSPQLSSGRAVWIEGDRLRAYIVGGKPLRMSWPLPRLIDTTSGYLPGQVTLTPYAAFVRVSAGFAGDDRWYVVRWGG
jgi:hypothetical protein